jgi:hypothetical protein
LQHCLLLLDLLQGLQQLLLLRLQLLQLLDDRVLLPPGALWAGAEGQQAAQAGEHATGDIAQRGIARDVTEDAAGAFAVLAEQVADKALRRQLALLLLQLLLLLLLQLLQLLLLLDLL